MSSGHYRKAEVPRPEPALITHSAATRALFQMVDQVARHDVTVLVTGETGTGKELVAQTLHARSRRARGPLIAINCATLRPSLMTATLFGHERGAFTGADQRRAGIFEAADGGTVFLDEVGELDAAAQAALLRVLETGRFTPVGSTREVSTDVRIVAATHRSLGRQVREGLFRSDLLYRLNAIGLEVPPLRERTEEIVPLAKHFLQQAVQRHDLPARSFAPPAVEALMAHSWPGNVRELRNVVERAAILAAEELIHVDDLPEHLRHAPAAPSPADAGCGHPHCRGELPGPGDANFRETVMAFERQLIEAALTATGGNRARAAERLGMPRRTLLNKLRALGL